MVNTFLMVLIWKNVGNFGKMAVFPGGYGRIGDILHGRIWPDSRTFESNSVEVVLRVKLNSFHGFLHQ